MKKNEDIVNSGKFIPVMTNQIVRKQKWPLSLNILDQETWMRDVCLQPRILHLDKPNPRFFLPVGNNLTNFNKPINNDDPNSFHRAMGSILVVAQCFGILPVSGVRSKSPKDLKFKILSFRIAYTILVMIMLLAMASMAIFNLIRTFVNENCDGCGEITATIGNVLFYSNSFLGTILFMYLAPYWPLLQLDWRATEIFLDRNKNKIPRLSRKFSILMAVVMIFALLEHILSIANGTLIIITSQRNSTFEDFLRVYSQNSHGFVFTICEYNIGLGIFVSCINKIGTFTWNFTDVFVILISTGLAERYKVLNKRVLEKISDYHRNGNWREYRESYAMLSGLVKRVDSNISPIILLSFANNICFICLQLFNGLSPRGSHAISTIYFFGSFAFLVSRTIAVTMMAARIHDQSKVILPVVYNCPGPAYSIETQRLQHQLMTDDVYLTGLRFFSITRNFMLAITGAIVTYEVLLLQLKR